MNLDPRQPITVQVKVAGASPRGWQGRLLTAPAMDAINTFDRPEAVAPVAFKGARVNDGVTRRDVPAKSVLVLSEVAR